MKKIVMATKKLKKKKQACTVCGGSGHNARTCEGPRKKKKR